MKTFSDLIQEVQKPGLCHRCGGCVSFCTAINFGALEMDDEGKPRYGNQEKCIECGICHAICPEIDELEEETRQMVSWSLPMGRVLETAIARAMDPIILESATDGGVVTAMLLHLYNAGRIDGAIVTRRSGPFQREPFLASSKKDIMDAAGFYFDTSHGMQSFSNTYSTQYWIREFGPMVKQGLRRVAFVGTPCQIKMVRRLEAIGVVPSDSIAYCLGLFCSGNFIFRPKEKEKLAKIGRFDWQDVRKINIKEDLLIHLTNGEIKNIMLDELEFMKRFACYFCEDYAAEFADISFGGIGAEEGWTTVITRTPLGRAIFADAKGTSIEISGTEQTPDLSHQAFSKVRRCSDKKRSIAKKNRSALKKNPKM